MIIVTGSLRGLGKSIADDLRKKGLDVIGLSRTPDNTLGDIQCDVSSYESIKNAAREVKKNNNNKVFALINAAGMASMNIAFATPYETSKKIVETNLLGAIYTNQIFGPMIIRNGGGRIINFSTLAVRLGIEGESIYIASKAGVEGFSRSLARELSDFNITVNCIAPGPIRTDLLRGVSEDKVQAIIKRQIFKKVLTEKDVVDQVNLLLSDGAKYLTGQVIAVGGS